MTINKTQENGRIILALDGRLDTTTAPQLQDILLPGLNEAREVTLDFANLAYVSSAGLRVLLMGEKTAKTTGHKQMIVNVSNDIMEVFEMTGFLEILHIE